MAFQNKPYVWLQESVGSTPILCITVYTQYAIASFTTEQDDSHNRLFVKCTLSGSSGGAWMSTSFPLGSDYDSTVHKRVTVKLLYGTTLLGSATMKPNLSNFI